MSMLDRRALGTLPAHAYAQEDKFDFGGHYMTAGSSVHMPTHETLAHNQLFAFLSQSNATIAEDQGCETPDLTEPFAMREEKAVKGWDYHIATPHMMEIRCCHPARRHQSTSTIRVIMLKKSK
jgi:hypothetical protein